MRAEALILAPAMAVGEGLAATLLACSRQVTANIPGVRRGRDPESLHQLRVGLRRLRAALSVYRPAMPPALHAAWSRKLRQLEHEMGPARDWDVLTAAAGDAAKGGAPRGFVKLLRLIHGRRGESYRKACEILVGAGPSRLMAEVDRFATASAAGGRRGPDLVPAEPIGSFARGLLDRRHRRVRRAGRKIERLDARELHRLRIRVKKLRYAAEFFASLWQTDASRDYLVALRRLQDELGLIQDAATGSGLLDAIGAAPPDGLEEPVVLTRRWIRKRKRRARKRLAGRWRAFETAERFWCAAPT